MANILFNNYSYFPFYMSEGKYQPESPKYATRCTFSHPWLKLSRQVRHKSILITPLCHSRCVLCAECKKYMQEVMQVAHIHLLFFFLSLSPYFICVQFTSMWKGPRVFKPSRQELRPPPEPPPTLSVTEDSQQPSICITGRFPLVWRRLTQTD